MAVLVTGVGVVGSQCARILVERGETPVLMDISPQKEPLSEIVDLDKVELVRGDVLKPFQLAEVVRSKNITHIIHTVANANLTLGAQEDPRAAIELNIMGTVNVLETARINQLQRVVISSSNVVAQHVTGGEGSGNMAVEEALPRPVTFYASTKQTVENLGLSYARWHGVDFAAVRYGAVAGPWSGRGGGGPSQAFRKAVTQAVRGHEVEVLGIGMEWVFASDAGEGTVLALFAPDLGSRVFNITMGTLVTPQAFADAIVEVFPGARIRMEDPAPGTSAIPDTHLASDISLAGDMLGYTPRYGIVEAVRKMAEWLESYSEV